MKVLFHAYIDKFQVYPYARMTGPGRFTKRAQRYLKNREALAWEFKQNRPPINIKCVMSAEIHLSHKRHVDLDNICKAIQDALQSSGVIKNDCLIVGYDNVRLYQDGEDWISISLREAE